MNPDLFALGFLEYVVFLFSTTCHEASHALVAKWGGDTTALEAGQVSLNPLPHIKREPFGMVIMPLLGIATGTLIGWASTPYNLKWAQTHPKRAAWMSLAGPVSNFTMAIISGIIMRIGLQMGSFVPAEFSFTQIVAVPPGAGGVAGGIATVLSVMFSLNILLGAFNLIPFPPLDGYGILGLFTTRTGRAEAAGMADEDGDDGHYRARCRLADLRSGLWAVVCNQHPYFIPGLSILLNPYRVP